MNSQLLLDSKRILILGPPGVGKTTFSKKLSTVLGLPVIHLDDEYWLPGWQRIESSKWLEKINLICQQSSWIIDGNHAKTYSVRSQYADLVIVLNYNRWRCLWRFSKRSLLRYCKLIKDLPQKIQQDPNYQSTFSIQWHLIKLILSYRGQSNQQLIYSPANHRCKVISIYSDHQLNALLAKTQQQLRENNND